MKVFLSWSGMRSKVVAAALRDWLPLALHYVKPWLSERDVAAGDRWSLEIARELEEATFGVIVVTVENLDAPWLLFEAGALSKAFTTSSVVPYLVDLEYSDLSGPLSLFQAKRADRAATLELLRSINQHAPQPIADDILGDLYDALWPKFEARLQNLPASREFTRPIRPEREVFEELVASIRRLESKAESRSRTAPLGVFTSADIGIPLSIVIVDDLPGLEKNAVVRVVAGNDAIADVGYTLGLDVESYGVEWCLTGTRTQRPISRDAGANLAEQARHGEVTLALRRVNAGAAA